VSRPRALDGGRLAGIGRGPIYAVPSPFRPYDRQPGWLGAKTLWAWPPSLFSHPQRVLVRGVRLDRSGPLRFQLGPQWDAAPRTAELRLSTDDTVGSFAESRWRSTVTMLLVRAGGCYGLQIDAARGSSTIVVEAAPAP
jgi:hypothetical protein